MSNETEKLGEAKAKPRGRGKKPYHFVIATPVVLAKGSFIPPPEKPGDEDNNKR